MDKGNKKGKKGKKQNDQGKSVHQAEINQNDPSSSSSKQPDHQKKKDPEMQSQKKFSENEQTEQITSKQFDTQQTDQLEVKSDAGSSVHLSVPPSSKEDPQAAKLESSNKSKKNERSHGDWTCSECQYTNFKRKTDCKKCKAPKPICSQQPEEQISKKIAQGPQPSQSIANTSMPSVHNLNISTISQSSCTIETRLDAKKAYEGTRGKKCKVEVNYVEINLKNLCPVCYHYDVEIVPDSPKKMLPAALQEFMRIFFKGYLFGFDGRKNMITNRKLVKETETEEFTGKVEAHFQDRTKSFDIKVKLVSCDNMDGLLKCKNDDKPAKAKKNLDIVLKSAFRKNIDDGLAVQAGRAVFFVPNEKKDLGDGMELWYGLFQSAILGRAKVYLNVDVLHKAFPSAVHLLDYLRIFDKNRQQKVPESLDPQSVKKLNEFLKKFTIGYRLNPNDPLNTFGFNGIGEIASRASFECNERMITVQEYFEREKKTKLKFPNLPVLWVESRTKKILLPIEFCELPPGQVTNKTCSQFCIRNLTNFSVTSTEDRKRKIRNLLDKIPYDIDPTIKGFGIGIGKNFQNVDARVIDSPNIKYSNGNFVKPRSGAWQAAKFIEVEENRVKWCILNGDKDTNLMTVKKFKDDLIKEAREHNIILEDIKAHELACDEISIKNRKFFENKFEEMKKSEYQLVVVIINDKDYQPVKQAAELSVGILTQCIKAKTLSRMNNTIIKNILLKLNAKLNGKNHEIDESSYKTISADAGAMFVGADVTHPSPDQKNIPSVVGVASSFDQVGFKYCCAWRLQNPKMEMIEDLESILVEHLKVYEQYNKKLPRKILYYRDGVSDGQFKEVLQKEMSAIRNALKRIYGMNKPAEVTFIVVQKRHHTRFFPTDKNFADKNSNILPGTVVDRDIVHPFQYQFFLASHAAIKGVTKPSKYCILVNESKIKPDDLQAITYDLCHLFTRCCRSVSYPAPTYYAHLVAARGKNYWTESELPSIMEDLDGANQRYQNNGINQKFVLKSPMFFV